MKCFVFIWVIPFHGTWRNTEVHGTTVSTVFYALVDIASTGRYVIEYSDHPVGDCVTSLNITWLAFWVLK